MEVYGISMEVIIILLFAMCISITLKLVLKSALLTGRIRQQSWRIHDPMPKAQMAAGMSDFSVYTRPMFPDKWTLFQHEKRMFRKSLDTKRLEEKLSFVFSGETSDQWIKIIRIC